MAGALDRAGHKLRKKRNVKRVIEEIAFGSDSADIHVHHVTDRLKSVEREPGWEHKLEHDAQRIAPEIRQKHVDVFQNKTGVFKCA